MRIIKENGGLTIVQNPRSAEVAIMPASVLKQVEVDHVLSLDEIPEFLNILSRQTKQWIEK